MRSGCSTLHMPSNSVVNCLDRIKILARDSIVYFIVVFGKLLLNDLGASGVELYPSIIIL